ncbi:MAG: Rieske 2Fe-2S domain-containing protein [Planctomycetaceae bacterium]|nr:Rieske 2Fe-2S domain-containing protein [Planctomycetaceae bacterium]
MADFEKVADKDELSTGERKSFIIDDLPALLVCIGDDYYAIEDVCSHDGQPLTDGPIVDCSIVCPRHGAKFDLKTGAAQCMPATEPVQTLTVDVREDGIYVEVPE